MTTSMFWVDDDRVQTFLATHGGIEPIAVNEPIGETEYTIPIVYKERDDKFHVVYFEDGEWDKGAIDRLLEWTVVLRFFSDRKVAVVNLEGIEPTEVAREIVSLQSVVLAKLAAILGLLLLPNHEISALVAISRRWFDQMLDIRFPEEKERGDAGFPDRIDAAVRVLDRAIEELFWCNGRWTFHPMEYIVMLGTLFGEMVRLRYGGRWVEATLPMKTSVDLFDGKVSPAFEAVLLKASVELFDGMLFQPFEAVLQMLEQGPDQSVWEQYKLLPIDWESRRPRS